jgi:hypothetical protein
MPRSSRPGALAGFFALLAGVFAYCGALKAAGRQVQLEEEKHKARVAAYRFRMDALTADLERLTAVCLHTATNTLVNFRRNGGSYPIAVPPLSPVPDLSEENWESHALLGQLAVRSIYNVNSRLRRFISFQQEVLQEGLKSNQWSKHSHQNPPKEKEDGSFELTYTNAAEVNETFARDLTESIKELKSIISIKK